MAEEGDKSEGNEVNEQARGGEVSKEKEADEQARDARAAKEAKIKLVALAYYSRKDVQKAIYEFCLKKEAVPRYMEGFGKRPDALEYPSDVMTLARNGATSFHCSEERWKNVLEISTDKGKDELDEMREGFDLLIDIDSKYFEVAKYAAVSIIESLEEHGVKNFGVKFSGNKGWHILVPWEAFPKEINNMEVRKMFPELPRKIVSYLMDYSKEKLEKHLKKDKGLWESLKKGSQSSGIRCEKCKNIASEFCLITLQCPMKNCRTVEQLKKPAKDVELEKDGSFKNGKRRKCVQCSSPMEEVSKVKFYFCGTCRIDSRDEIDSRNFSGGAMPDIYEQLGLDVILVSPRHLFRTPYSLHEKTALASVVINKSEILSFSHKDADPVRVFIKPFLPNAEPDEAKKLVVAALDSALSSSNSDKSGKTAGKSPTENNEGKKFADVNIDRSKLKYPPSIEAILKGMQDDGRKRALFILISYFRSLNFTEEEVTKLMEEWNKKNKKPLREGYIKSQIEWSFRHATDADASRQKKFLPPNYDKPYYKGIGIHPTDEELKYKNPINYTIKKMFGSIKTSSGDKEYRDR